jgi:hypothetical protein
VPARIIPQVLQQRLRLLEIGRVKALGEPAVDRCQQIVCCLPFSLLLPQPTQTRGSTQLPRLGLLATGNGQGLLETNCSPSPT